MANRETILFNTLNIELVMSWNTTLSWQHAQQRAKIIRSIRSFFSERNVVEVETPALSQGTVTDVHLNALSCDYHYFSDSSSEQANTLSLQTSPEFHMKRLLASGYGCIFQIAKAFRHEEHGHHHNPEFTMLEWYRLGFDHFDLMKEVADLLTLILNCDKPTFQTYQSLFIKITSIDPLNTDRKSLLNFLEQHEKLSDWLIADSKDDYDTLLQFIFSECVEPTIGHESPCFVYHFPSAQASLAQLSKKDGRVAERFEC
jgi:lysyl-tRNA synthetase class 2